MKNGMSLLIYMDLLRRVISMKKWKQISESKKPCDRCLYKMGVIHTFISPCPICKLNNYRNILTIEKVLGKYNEYNAGAEYKFH